MVWSTALRPLLFILYVNDISCKNETSHSVRSPGLRADGKSVLKPIDNEVNRLRREHLQHTEASYLRTAKIADKSDTKRVQCQTSANKQSKKKN